MNNTILINSSAGVHVDDSDFLIGSPPVSEETFVINNRRITDKQFLYIYPIFLTILLGFLAYCFNYGDISRFIDIPSNVDINYVSPFQEFAEDLKNCWREVVDLCFIATGLSIFLIVLLRFFIEAMVWIVIVGVVAGSAILTATLWSLYATTDDTQGLRDSFLYFAIASTVLTLVVISVVVAISKHIHFVIQLFKEAGKAVGDMPVLLFEPLLTYILLTVVTILWMYFSLIIKSVELELNSRTLKFKSSPVAEIAYWLNLFVMLWTSQFLIACQHMVISGCVSKWYFTRNKQNFITPFFEVFSIVVKYHLGSALMGAFIIAIIRFLRNVFRAIRRVVLYSPLCLCCCCCLQTLKHRLHELENLLKFMCRNTYIYIALHGEPFFKSGTKVFELLTRNALRVVAINSAGDFVLFLGKMLVVVGTVAIGFEFFKNKPEVKHEWFFLLLAGMFAFLVAHCFLTVYELAIDTIFICFCEDCEENDGQFKPYYMSKDLMDFVENSRRSMGVGGTPIVSVTIQHNFPHS